MPKTIPRRSFIKTALASAAAAPLVLRLSTAAATEDTTPLLDVNDPTAQGLAYVAEATKVDATAYPSYKPGQKCSNCKLWQGEPADKLGGCELVLGQYVLGAAWCKAWEAKSSSV